MDDMIPLNDILLTASAGRSDSFRSVCVSPRGGFLTFHNRYYLTPFRDCGICG